MKKYFFSASIIIIVAVGFSVITYSKYIYAEILEFEASMNYRLALHRTSKPEPIIARGIYLTAVSAARESKRQEIIKLIQDTELNSVVIDIKDYTGHILYDSSLDRVDELDTDRDTLKNVHTILQDFKDAGIYTIARQTVFQDPALAEANPAWAIKRADGSVWRDYKGLSWVDPTVTAVWDYNMDIAKEAAGLGFDEINFDYVRFPSDGPIRQAVYADLHNSKEETMADFYQYVHDSFENIPVFTSLDLFGLVLESHSFDLNIGQRLEFALDTVDYIYPMTYPSHYPSGHLGMENPADFPYEVVTNGLQKARLLVEGKETQLRPWLQAFNIGAVYDGAKIRAQIKAVEESDVTAGWMLWNASNRYSSAGLAGPDEMALAR